MNQLPPDDKLLSRIGKLLALAADASNEHEAALAASRANELLFKHNLTRAEVERTGRILGNKDPVGENAVEDVFLNNKVLTWKMSLFNAVAYTNFCKVLYHQSYQGYRQKKLKTATLIGRESNVEVARFTYSYLVREIERLARLYAEERMQEFDDMGFARAHLRGRKNIFRNSFLKGAAETVGVKLREEFEAMRAANAESTALVVSETASLSSFIGDKYGRIKGHSNIGKGQRGVDAASYYEGQRRGSNISLRKGIGASPIADEGRLLS